MTEIRRATLHDLPGAYRVCLLTGDAGEDASGQYANPDLLGHIYVGPYIVGEPDLALIAADEDGVAGYCLAARDTRALADWAELSWWPPLRDEFPARSDGTADAGLIDLIHAPPIVPDQVLERYPAQLHIDLVERARGTGVGRRLVERQVNQLKSGGAAACHLVVAASNINAIGFYEHLGWRVLERPDDGWVMGIELA